MNRKGGIFTTETSTFFPHHKQDHHYFDDKAKITTILMTEENSDFWLQSLINSKKKCYLQWRYYCSMPITSQYPFSITTIAQVPRPINPIPELYSLFLTHYHTTTHTLLTHTTLSHHYHHQYHHHHVMLNAIHPNHNNVADRIWPMRSLNKISQWSSLPTE